MDNLLHPSTKNTEGGVHTMGGADNMLMIQERGAYRAQVRRSQLKLLVNVPLVDY